MNTCSSTWKTVEKTCTLPLYHTGDHVDGWFSWPNTAITMNRNTPSATGILSDDDDTAHRCHVGCEHDPGSGNSPTGFAHND
jgi:hypothetical protein